MPQGDSRTTPGLQRCAELEEPSRSHAQGSPTATSPVAWAAQGPFVRPNASRSVRSPQSGCPPGEGPTCGPGSTAAPGALAGHEQAWLSSPSRGLGPAATARRAHWAAQPLAGEAVRAGYCHRARTAQCQWCSLQGGAPTQGADLPFHAAQGLQAGTEQGPRSPWVLPGFRSHPPAGPRKSRCLHGEQPSCQVHGTCWAASFPLHDWRIFPSPESHPARNIMKVCHNGTAWHTTTK